ncbi:DNA-binding domain-containing protein [Legionella santicrucis]|nr:DNA-binding domain-containing protein [Legionella santicrucis]
MKNIRESAIAPEFRLNIYRNNIFQNLYRALEITFPAVWKLVGKECADNLAAIFCREEKNLPITNCLDDWGASFPRFLHCFEPIQHLIYLSDIAELEWLKHMSYRASNFSLINPLKWPKKLAFSKEIYLIFNPSVYLFSSPYSLKEIVNLIEMPDEKQNINLQPVACYAVISRQYHRVTVHWISQDMFRFFISLQNRLSLIHAYETVYEINPDFDVHAALQFIRKNHLMWKIEFASNTY